MNNNLAVIESDSVVVSMTRARTALAEAVTVGQTKMLIDVAYAAEIYSKRHQLSDEAIHQATSVKVEATRKLGEILKATPKATGRFDGGNKKVPPSNEAPTLEELGLTKKESAVAQKLASLPEEQFEQVRLGNITIAKAIAVIDAKPKPTPEPPPVVEPEPEAPIDYTELDAAHDQISELQSELVVARMGDVTDEDKQQAAELIAELRAEIKTLTATLASVNNSRDSLMEENAQMKSQMQMQRKEIAKLKNSN